MSLNSPVLIGIYENSHLIKSYKSDEKASNFLIVSLNEIMRDYSISRLIYANGPGSFMGIKVAYVILKTLSISKNLPFVSVSGFELNGGEPIRANKALSFVQKNGEISLEKTEPKSLNLPLNLLNLKLNNDTLPNYIISEI